MIGISMVLSALLRRFIGEERGDQNVGNLGLIVVAVAIIGILMSKFVPAVGEIVDGVILKLKCSLGISPSGC